MRNACLAGLLVLGLGVAPAVAREGAETGAPQSHVTVTAKATYPLLSRLDVTLRDADLARGLGLLETALGGAVEFITEPVIENLRIPDFTVRNLRGLDVLHLVQQLVPDLEVVVNTGNEYDDVENMLSMEDGDIEDWAPRTVVVLIRLREYQNDNRMLRVFRLAGLLEEAELTIDDVATAIETVWEMGARTRAASLRFHEKTGLMICSGTEQHIDLAERVLDRIAGRDHQEQKVAELHQRLKQAEDVHANLLKQLQHVQLEKTRLDAKVAQLEAELRSRPAADK